MKGLLLIVGLIVAIIAIFLIMRRSTKEAFGTFKNDQMAFATKQFTYFQDKMDKGILTNAGLSLSGVNDAMKQPDLYLGKSLDRDYKSFLVPDPEGQYSLRDKKFCRGAKQPRNLPARTAGSTTACGWWFVSDPNAPPSSGALGTHSGPLFTDSLYGGGEWIWNLEVAQMKEDIKLCKKVKSCDLLDVDGIHGQCGFCKRLGYAVPIFSDNTEKYPESQDGACGAAVTQTTAACNYVEPTPLVTEDGTNCGTAGHPSTDNSLRLYSTDECTKLKGKFSANGECKKQEGGSFSWDCRALNDPVISKNVCDPQANGRLSKECLISLIKGIGYTDQGAMFRILHDSALPEETDTLALNQLKIIGVSVPSALFGDGNVDKTTAGNIYKQIYDIGSSGRTEILREAAKWLTVGTDKFDICNVEGSSSGPFDTVCAQRAFRQAGCQAAGKAYPTSATVAGYANMTWNEMNGMFRKLRDDTKSTVRNTQAKAASDCLGIAFQPKQPKECEDYSVLPDSDNSGYIQCFSDGSPVSRCKALCKDDKSCKGIVEVPPNNVWGAASGCCTKDSASNRRNYPGLTFYTKKATAADPLFDFKSRTDHGGDDIACFSDGRSEEFCRNKCIDDPNCRSYNKIMATSGGPGGCCYKTAASPTQPNEAVNLWTKITVPITVSGRFRKSFSGGRAYFRIIGPATITVVGNAAGVKFFAVGGGGGAGTLNGGGGGGVQTNTESYKYQSQRAGLNLQRNSTYNVTIGDGGRPGVNGGNTTITGPGVSITAIGGAYGGATGIYCPSGSGGSGGGGCASYGAQGGSVNTAEAPFGNAGAGAGGNIASYWGGGPGVEYNGVVYGAAAADASKANNGAANTGAGGSNNSNGGSGVFIISYISDEPDKGSGTSYEGCFNDCAGGGRAIPNIRSWNMQSGDNLKECEGLAKQAGDNVFGLQYYRECWTGKDAEYDRMGSATGCPPNGGGCTQQVYTIS